MNSSYKVSNYPLLRKNMINHLEQYPNEDVNDTLNRVTVISGGSPIIVVAYLLNLLKPTPESQKAYDSIYQYYQDTVSE